MYELHNIQFKGKNRLIFYSIAFLSNVPAEIHKKTSINLKKSQKQN